MKQKILLFFLLTGICFGSTSCIVTREQPRPSHKPHKEAPKPPKHKKKPHDKRKPGKIFRWKYDHRP